MTPALAALLAIASIQAASRAVWIDAASGDATACEAAEAQWTCPGVSAGSRGLLLVIGGEGVRIARSSGVADVDPSPAAWGRVVRLVAASAADADLHDIALTAWRPERSAVRAKQRRFQAVRDDSVHALKLSDAVFWVSGSAATDPDAFLAVDGPAIGSVRAPTVRLRDGAPEAAFLVPAPQAASIVGRVRNARGEDVPSARVELFQPLRFDPEERLGAETPAIARAATVADENGSFVFERMSEVPLLLVATGGADGRGSLWMTSPGPPVVIDLVPPLRAHGRVIRRGLGAAGVRIRFVPTVDAWAASSDPASNLTEEVVTGDNGAFELTLPEQSSGELQAVTAEGLTARVPLVTAARGARAIDVGDIAIPDPIRVVVRLLEPMQSQPCDIVAAGPFGRLGMQMLRASSAVNVYTLDLPEDGQWVLSADCGGIARSVVPMVATVATAETGPGLQTIDVRFVR